MNIRFLNFDALDSTNDEALKQARQGADEGLCIVARQQTAGRGRHGRSWMSERDAGLYFSIVLRPQIEPKFLPLITLMTGVAVFDVIAGFGLAPDIKWVNDILIGEKKVCGILAETTETNGGIAVIVGIGINVRPVNFPPALAGIATSIETELGHPVAISQISEPVARSLASFYSMLTGENGPECIIDQWRKRSTFYSGKAVRVVSGDEVLTGKTDGLEETGALRLSMVDGTIRLIHAGDVQQLRQDVAK